MGPIVIGSILSATNSDLLASTRLQTAPGSGVLTIELEADNNDATNYFEVTLQLPNGDTPMENVRVPAQPAGTAGVLDDREKLQISVPVQQGGHVTLSLTETGAAICAYRVTYSPAR